MDLDQINGSNPPPSLGRCHHLGCQNPIKMKKTILTTLLVIGVATCANAQDINGWTTKNLKKLFGTPAIITYAHGKIKTVTFPAGPHGEFHGPDCFEIILGFLRGPNADPTHEDDVDVGKYGEGPWVDPETGCTITMDHSYDAIGTKLPPVSWHFTATKNGATILTAEMIESWRLGPKLILHLK